MTPELQNTLFYGVVAGLATFAGVYLLYAREAWARRNTVFFLSFSAGVVLTVAFTHLLAEAIELGTGPSRVLTVTLLTLIAFYVLEHTIILHTCNEGDCDVHDMGITSFMGITFHSLVDGVVIGVGFEADFTVGLTAALAILLHKLPVGITVSSLLLHAGYSRGRTLVMGSVVAVATALGAVGAALFLSGVAPSTLAILLAFSAGSFIYVGASDLLPETHKNFSLANIPLVLSGVVLVYIVTSITGGH